MENSKTEQTTQAYNSNIDRYVKKFMEYKPYQKQITSFQDSFIQPKATVLDIGCGPGINAKILLENDSTLQITGADLSQKAIELARIHVPNASFAVEDIREITTDIAYDTVIAAFCIVHLSDAETIALVKTISQILPANGTLYLSFMEGKMPGFETTSFSQDKMFFNYFNRNEIIELLAEHGLATMQTSTEIYREEDGSTTTDVFVFAQKSLFK